MFLDPLSRKRRAHISYTREAFAIPRLSRYAAVVQRKNVCQSAEPSVSEIQQTSDATMSARIQTTI